MKKLYGQWMERWEDRLCSRATNRVVRPFDWGLEWTPRLACGAEDAPQTATIRMLI